MDKALAIIDMMLEKIPEVAEELVRRGAEVSVFGLLENAYDVPEHRMGYLACNPPCGRLRRRDDESGHPLFQRQM